jgi:selenocysteine-specific elongation factor
MRVIGTAGHVDHGKSTLVQALTGINPDRLREEQEREMTIDLGFAWLTLPSGLEVSVVDVPGHEDFIKNMLAGIGGVDLAMLIIAADEAVMPQTREHLAILDLLRVPRGVVVLTKADLVDDPEWLELVQADVATVLEGTILAKAPMIPVSARTGQGLETLRATLDNLLQTGTPRADLGRPRLPVDRAFTMSGFGTVVTGTLLDGGFSVGDEIELQPGGLRGRIRGLQSHKQKVSRAQPGRRVAINISGIEVNQVQRGQVVVRSGPGSQQPTTLVDVTLRVLPDAPRPLKHNQALDFFSGAAETPGSLRLIGVDELRPGEEGAAQIRLAAPLVLARGDRYILRQPSPSQTLGGGSVLDPHPARRWRRLRPETVERFRLLAEGTPADLLLQRLEASEPTDEASLKRGIPFAAEVAEAALQELLDTGRARRQGDGSLLSASGWTRLSQALTSLLGAYHTANPLRLGMPREELASKLGLKPKPFGAFLSAAIEAGLAAEAGGLVRLPEHEVRLSAPQQRQIDTLLAEFAKAPYTPPNAGDSARALGDELLALLIARGELVRVSQEVLLAPTVYQELRGWVVEYLQTQGEITAAELRDRFNTSRKYAIALLEHLDDQRVTRRLGDKRVLR